jgi:hypothetical protein
VLIDGVTLGLEDGAAAQEVDAPQLAQCGAQQTDGRSGLVLIDGVTMGLDN